MRPILSTVTLNHHAWPVVLDIAKASGFTDIELLMIPGWVHLVPESMAAGEVIAAFRERGLRLVGIHAGGIDGTSEESLASTTTYIRNVITFAGSVGATFININGMPVHASTTASGRQTMLRRIIRALATLQEPSSSLGLTITLENHVCCHIETLEDYQAIFEAFPLPQHAWLGATLDTGHFAAADIAPAHAAAVLGQRVLHVHIKDHRVGRSVALGDGEIDNLGCVRALHACGYAGFLSAELELSDAEAERQGASMALPYLQHLITTVQERA